MLRAPGLPAPAFSVKVSESRPLSEMQLPLAPHAARSGGDRNAEPCSSCEARAVSICNAIEDRDLHRLAEASVVMRVAPGQVFIDEGGPADSFFNVTAGTVRLFKLLPDGRRQITGFAVSGHFLGLAMSSVYAFGAEAIDRVRVCRFARPKLRRLLDDFPAMEKRLLEVASDELIAAQEQMLLLGRKTARERLASFLVAPSRLSVACEHSRMRLILPMTRNDIADYLGLTIETVSRTLTRFRTEGLIALPSASEVLLLDVPALRQIADALN